HDRGQALRRRAGGAGARQYFAARAFARHRPYRVAGADNDDYSPHVRQLRRLPLMGLPLMLLSLNPTAPRRASVSILTAGIERHAALIVIAVQVAILAL